MLYTQIYYHMPTILQLGINSKKRKKVSWGKDDEFTFGPTELEVPENT